MSNYYHAVIFSLLGAGALWASRKYFGHILSPFGVFYGVWFTALAMFCIRWVNYAPLGGDAERLIAMSMGAFGLGWVFIYAFIGDRAVIHRTEVNVTNISIRRMRRVIILVFGFGLIGLGDFLWNVQSSLGLTTFVQAPYLIRQAMGIGDVFEGIKFFNWLNVMNVVLCTIYLELDKTAKRKVIKAILIVSVAATLVMEDRTRFFYAVLWAGFVLAHMRKWKVKKVIVGGAMVGLLLIVQFLAVASWLGKVAQNSPAVMAAESIPDQLDFLLPPYVYLTGSFPALQAYVQNAQVSTGGEMTFRPLFEILSRFDSHLTPPDVIGDFYEIPFPFNTYTWLQQFYSDFGVAGAFLGPMVVGLLAGLVYFRFLRSGSAYGVYVNGLFSFCLAISVLVNHFTQGPAWYFLGLGWLIFRYLARRPAPTKHFVGNMGRRFNAPSGMPRPVPRRS
ncbi:MAG: O-antigen polymerase [Candidatus Acidiferrales bacterium]